MAQACWQAAADGRYCIDVRVGNQDLLATVDSGLIDKQHHVGFEVEPQVYDSLKQTAQLSLLRTRLRRDASGRHFNTECGLTTAQLICPMTRLGVGPVVRLHVLRGTPGLGSRVGVVFFHLLHGCRVFWDLDSRTWCIDYP